MLNMLGKPVEIVGLLNGWLTPFVDCAGVLGDKDERDDKLSEAGEEDLASVDDARKEVDDRRSEKFRKLEDDRERMRQEIRDKVSNFFVAIIRLGLDKLSIQSVEFKYHYHLNGAVRKAFHWAFLLLQTLCS